MIRLLLAAFAVLTVASFAAAEVQSATPKTGLRQCVRVIPLPAGDVLENACAGCRLVSVQRVRPGTSKPTSQTLTVPERTRQPLPFLGPGHTRITAERPCPGAAPEPLRASTSPARNCVRFVEDGTGGAALINPCKTCRAVNVEFVDTAGNRSRRAFAIAPCSPLRFPAAGLATARILADAPCG